jgi:NADPH:quinone reductase-like Zn-dependent oxidoreductase
MKALDYGCHEFIDLDKDSLEDVGNVDLVFDVIGGEVGQRSANLIRTGGVLVSVVGPPAIRPENIRIVDFVVETDRAQLIEISNRIRDGRLKANIGRVVALEDTVTELNMHNRVAGKTIIRIRC